MIGVGWHPGQSRQSLRTRAADPGSSMARHNLADTLTDMGRNAEAVSHWRVSSNRISERACLCAPPRATKARTTTKRDERYSPRMPVITFVRVDAAPLIRSGIVLTCGAAQMLGSIRRGHGKMEEAFHRKAKQPLDRAGYLTRVFPDSADPG